MIGPRLLVPFRVHHLNPDDFLRRRFLDTNGDVAAVTIPALVGSWSSRSTARGARRRRRRIRSSALGAMTNQIHQWAHMPSPPAVARVLQKAGVLLRPGEHAGHHRGPYERSTASRPDGATAHSKPFDSSSGSKTPSPVSRERCRGPTNAAWRRELAVVLARWRRMSDRTREPLRGVDVESSTPSRSRAHLALETTEPMSAGHGFISGLLSALLGIAGFGLVLSLRFPEPLMFGELRSLYASPYLRAVIHVALVTAFLFGSVSAFLRANKTLALTGLGFTLAAALLGGSGA